MGVRDHNVIGKNIFPHTWWIQCWWLSKSLWFSNNFFSVYWESWHCVIYKRNYTHNVISLIRAWRRPPPQPFGGEVHKRGISYRCWPWLVKVLEVKYVQWGFRFSSLLSFHTGTWQVRYLSNCSICDCCLNIIWRLARHLGVCGVKF